MLDGRNRLDAMELLGRNPLTDASELERKYQGQTISFDRVEDIAIDDDGNLDRLP